MKKILAVTIIAIMAAALCSTAFAAETATTMSLDRIYLNGAEQPLFDGWQIGEPLLKESPIDAELTEIRIRGWGFFNDCSEIEEFGYKIDDGEPVIVSGAAFVDEGIFVHLPTSKDTVRRYDFSADVSNVGKGEHTFTAVIKAKDGTVAEMTPTFTFTQQKEAAKADDPAPTDNPTPADNPGTADASVIAIAAVACIALAGVVVAKKVR